MVLITNNSFKLASIKYISKAVYSKYLRVFYKYLQCLKKNSGELLQSAPCTWHQNALLSSPCDTDAMTSRICSCHDGELVQMLTRRGTLPISGWSLKETLGASWHWQVSINLRQVSAISHMRSPQNHRAGLLTCFAQDISFIHSSTP